MNSIAIGLTGVAALFILLLMRVPVAVAMLLISWAGLSYMLSPDVAWGVLRSIPVEFAANWTISAVPMFLLMGYIAFHAGLTTGLFELARALLGRLPGSIAISSIAACSGFSAVSGSSLACAAAMGRIAIPEMVKAGYNKDFACGTVAAGGTIGALIPPSIIMILYGVFAQVSILNLFVAGIGMGLLTAFAYVAVILIQSWRRPDIVPRRLDVVEKGLLGRSLRQLWPVIIMIFGLFGGLFGGLFTTTEAGAIGALMATVIALVQGRLTVKIMVDSLTETVSTCGTIFVIGVGATMFTKFLSISGTGDFIAESVNGMELGYFGIFAIVVLVYVVLGTFMDGIGAMLITLPIFLPILDTASINLVFFGIIVTKLIEIGMITPPFGLNVFVIRSVVGDLTSVMGIFRGILLFLIADIVVLALVIVFPRIVMFLPDLLGR